MIPITTEAVEHDPGARGLASCDSLDRMWGLDCANPEDAPVDDVRPIDAHSMNGDSALASVASCSCTCRRRVAPRCSSGCVSTSARRGVYPTPDEQGDVRAVTDLDFLVERLRVHGDEVRVVTGHFPLCTTDLLGGGFTTFTVLRDPVERTLSLLRRRQNAEERFHGRDLGGHLRRRLAARHHPQPHGQDAVAHRRRGDLRSTGDAGRVRSGTTRAREEPTCETESTCSDCKSTSTTSASTSRTGSTGISVRLGSRTGRSARR